MTGAPLPLTWLAVGSRCINLAMSIKVTPWDKDNHVFAKHNFTLSIDTNSAYKTLYTMQYSTLTIAALSLLGTHVSAKTISIEVGRNGASFSPNSVTAAVGDILEYRFAGGRHSVVRADFSRGCTPASNNGFSSGLQGSVSTILLESSPPTNPRIAQTGSGVPSHRH